VTKPQPKNSTQIMQIKNLCWKSKVL